MKKYLAHYALPLDLFEEFKKVCQAEGRTMVGTVVMLIRVWLKGLREGRGGR